MSNEGTVKAIAYGLLDGGLDFSTNYPGFFSQDIFELINTENKKISLNERSAFAEVLAHPGRQKSGYYV